MSLKKIKRAIISVSDKSNLKVILPLLKKLNVEIISSGGSYKFIRRTIKNCVEVSEYTGFSEMLNGRVKTLHPKIHGGILNIRNNKKHLKDLKKFKIPNIDLVIIDLYPFEEKLNQKINFNKLIEYIDIGGFALLRAAAKNFNDVTVISNISDYSKLVNELKVNKGKTSVNFRKIMSAKTFGATAYYDSVISNFFNENLNIKFPEKKTIHGNLLKNLRYGENPHQESSLYSTVKNFNLKQLNGKIPSYNNYNDIYASLEIIRSFNKNNGTVIIKHATPCGASTEKNQIRAFKNALKCDPMSAYGGVIAVNSVISKQLAIEIKKRFFEVVIAKGFSTDALKIFKKKDKLILINFSKSNLKNDKSFLFHENTFLIQDINKILLNNKKLKIVTKKKPTLSQMKSLKFAFNICKFVKSNAIVLAFGQSTIGIGSGQPSRLDSCKIAIDKALYFSPEKIFDAVAASDAFFPFPDGIKKLIDSGIKAIIQPGGSINDKKVIQEANKAGISMVFTGIRHFKH